MIDPAEARKHAQQYRVELGRLTQTAPMVIEAMAAEIERLRATIRCCIVAMRSAQQSKVHTDWTQMIAGLEETVPEQKTTKQDEA